MFPTLIHWSFLRSPLTTVGEAHFQTLHILTACIAAGDEPNSASDGKAAGHNTDGFDCSTTDLTIEDSVIMNQDDCLAINKGSNIVFQGNTCSGGHGISIVRLRI